MKTEFNFTKEGLNALPNPEQGKRVVYRDAKTTGLQIRVTSTGIKTFCIFRRIKGGHPERITLGRYPEMTIEQARRNAANINAEIENGENPAEKKRGHKAEMTLGEAFERYMKEYAAPHGVKRIDDIRAMWERCLGDLPDLPAKKHGKKRTKHPKGVNWQNRKLEKIKTTDVRSLHSAIATTHPTMSNRVVELLSTIFNRAIEWGFKGDNPTKGVKAFSEIKRDRFMQPEEIPRFLKALADDTNEAFKAFVLLSLLTGARRENVLGMRWDQVSFERAVWTVPDNVSKNKEPITIPLASDAIEIFKERRKETGSSPFIFPAKSKTGYMTPPKKRWEALRERAGLGDLRIHDLRRTMGSWQAITGASLAIIGKSLGHKSVDATMIYARLHIDPVRDSMERATAAMMSHAGLKDSAEVVSIKKKTEK